jgi:hypothetical protein
VVGAYLVVFDQVDDPKLNTPNVKSTGSRAALFPTTIGPRPGIINRSDFQAADDVFVTRVLNYYVTNRYSLAWTGERQRSETYRSKIEKAIAKFAPRVFHVSKSKTGWVGFVEQ